MTILVDIDSTITNFAEILLKYSNFTYKTSYKYEDISSYEWFDATFKDPWIFTNYKNFWNAVTVDSKAVTTLESWIKQGHRIYLVTASHFNSMLSYKIKRTLEAFNPKIINERNVVITHDKSIINGNVMIDDCVDNLIDFNGARICYAQPWNQHYGGSLRFSDWNNLRKCLMSYIDSVIFGNAIPSGIDAKVRTIYESARKISEFFPELRFLWTKT